MSNRFAWAREHFDREGYVVVPDVIDQDLIREARDHVEWLQMKNPGVRPEHLHTHMMTRDAFWVRLISDDRLLDVAEAFIGPNIGLFASHYIVKPPRDGMPVLWHQDGSYWPLEPMEVVTLWLAVDDSVPENGCMRVIPRTQTLEIQPMQASNDVANVLSSEIDPKFVDESQAVDIIVKAGGVSVHHPNIIHGSNANNSPMRRAGLTIRYIPTTTRITVDPWPSAFLLRGKGVPGINNYRPYPKYTPETSVAFRGMESFGEALPELAGG